jgi:uncharacterized protein YbaA (DUF1428 family)
MIWPVKETADAAHQKMMADPHMEEQSGAADGSDMPFDSKRMVFGAKQAMIKIDHAVIEAAVAGDDSWRS